jgi:hypothetical protein
MTDMGPEMEALVSFTTHHKSVMNQKKTARTSIRAETI